MLDAIYQSQNLSIEKTAKLTIGMMSESLFHGLELNKTQLIGIKKKKLAPKLQLSLYKPKNRKK